MMIDSENNQKKPVSEGKGKGKGGYRQNSGRKPGTANKKTREIADKVAETGLTPLEVMIEAMREAYNTEGAIAAHPFARDAAPYMHPRMGTVELTGKNGEALSAGPTIIMVCGPDE